MSTMIIWMLGIGFSVAALVLSAALKLYYIHMCIAALISILVALASFNEVRSETAAGSDVSITISTCLRHMGLVWVWGALALLVTYAFDALEWREWWHFFMGFFIMSGLSLFLAATLKKDNQRGAIDPTMIDLARAFAIVMFFAMVATMIGLVIDGKMWRFTTVAGLRRGSQDWAANNIFFFGAMALASISCTVVNRLGWRPAKTA